MNAQASTRNAADHALFETLGGDWWNLDGPLATLHHFNPARVAYLVEAATAHFGEADARTPLTGKTVLDVGCGGGIFAESLARLGGKVTGIDTVEEAIDAATNHAKVSGLNIGYHTATIEELAAQSARYDIITASEVIEHVANAPLFLASCAQLLKPNGLLFMTTLNRTAKSLVLGIGMAEYVLKLAPKGTHEWGKFLKPSELGAMLQENGLTIGGLTGLRYNPITKRTTRSATDLSINYMMWAAAPAVKASGRKKRV